MPTAKWLLLAAPEQSLPHIPAGEPRRSYFSRLCHLNFANFRRIKVSREFKEFSLPLSASKTSQSRVMTGSPVSRFHLSVFNGYRKARLLLIFCMTASSLNNKIKEGSTSADGSWTPRPKAICVEDYFVPGYSIRH